MKQVDVTELVMARMEHLADRIAHLQSVGDDKSAEVLMASGSQLADAADSEDEFILIS